MSIAVILSLYLGFSTAVCQETSTLDWSTDFEAAKQQSAKDGMPVLLYFTGSDWCSPCKALDKEVTGTKEFLNRASKLTHLVKVDIPHQPGIVEPGQLDKNKQLAKDFKINAYPTLMFVSKDNHPLLIKGQRDMSIETIVAECQMAKLRLDHIASVLKLAENNENFRPVAARELLALLGSANTVNQHYGELVGMVEQPAAPLKKSSKEMLAVDELRNLLQKATSDTQLIAIVNKWAKQEKLNSLPLRRLAYTKANDAHIRLNKTKDAWALTKTLKVSELATNPKSYVTHLYSELKEAIEGGDEAIAKLVDMKRSDAKYKTVMQQVKKTADATKKLELMQPLKELNLCLRNKEWLFIQIGFTHELLDDQSEAITAFKRAIEVSGDNETANKTFAKKQIDRLSVL